MPEKFYTNIIFRIVSVHFCDSIDFTKYEITAKTCKQISDKSFYTWCNISFISYAGQLLAIWDNERYSFDHYLMLQTPVIFIYVAVIFSMLNFPLITADRLIYSYCLGDYYSICDTHDYNRQCLGSWNQEMFRERHLCCCSYNRFHYALYIEFLRICGSEGQTKSVWENHSWHREHSSAQW